MKNNFLKSIWKFFKAHTFYAILSIAISFLQIFAIIYDCCKWLAILGVIVVLVTSFINKHKSDTIDCGEF